MAQADGMHADTLGAALFLCSIKDALLGRDVTGLDCISGELVPTSIGSPCI